MTPRTLRQIPDRLRNVVVLRDLRSWFHFFGANFLHRRGLEELAVDFQRLDRDGEISGVGEGAVVEDWGCERVGSIEGNSSAA